MACEHEIICEPGQSIMEVQNLSFAYNHRQQILKDVSLTIPAGKICGLLGPNGSGKTTLFRCCMNFLKPLKGEINLLGKPLQQYTPAHLAQHVAYVPQEHKLAFPFTVREMVAMGRSPHLGFLPVLAKKDWEIVDHILEKMALSHLNQQHYGDLSGGQRQLVLVARALAQQAALIFLDEPTSSLDFANQMLVWESLMPIVEEGVGIFVCCHDPNHILWFCDDLVVMKHGEIVAQGATEQIMSAELLQMLYGRKISVKKVGMKSFIYFDKEHQMPSCSQME